VEGAVCIPNIGPQERRRRLRFGLVACGLAVVVAVALAVTGLSPLFRLALFVPFWVGSIGVLQAKEKT
jgi:hypothetical protein